jgi:DNA-binding transcriptional regulator YdaS (Cro superfamily)
MSNKKEALERAIRIAGGQSELERKLKAQGTPISQQTLSVWIKAGEVRPGWALQIARAIEFAVTPHELDRRRYPNPWDGCRWRARKRRSCCRSSRHEIGYQHGGQSLFLPGACRYKRPNPKKNFGTGDKGGEMQQQVSLFYEDVNDVLRAIVQALGGAKRVGARCGATISASRRPAAGSSTA